MTSVGPAETTSTADSAAADGRLVSFEVLASRMTATLPQAWRRVPFTLTAAAVILLLGLVTRTIWEPITTQEWFPSVAYGVPALQEGKIWTLATGLLFAAAPGQYIGGLVAFVVLVGACEIRMGTKVVAIAAVVGSIGGVLIASLLVWALAATPWVWAQQLVTVRDVGFTTGTLTVLAVTTAALRSPWRLRVRAVLWFVVTVAVFFQGTLADVAHAVAVGVGFLVGQRLFGIEPGFGPRTRRETRMIAFAGLIMIGATDLVVLLLPGSGPFGETAGQVASSAFDVATDLIIIAIVANALRLGKKWAWWVAVVFGVFNLITAGLALGLILASLLP